MCRFKSGLIFKNRVVLAPVYNESHSRLLEREGIEDSVFNAKKVFVRAELIPKNRILSDVDEWEYHVDQDIVPDWYDEDPKKYERMFREAVKDWRDKNIFDICGVPCTKLKEENGKTYYHVCEPLFDSTFGDNNNYKLSDVRNRVLTCGFANDLKEKYEDKLVPISMDLTSLDGLHDYGCINGEDLLAIPNIDLYRDCRDNILCGDECWWLSTPDSTPSGIGALYVRCVRSGGNVDWDCIGYACGVRPFFVLKKLKKQKIQEKTMSYDIYLKERNGGVVHFDAPHQMTGGTYAVGGTTEAWLNITYNYARWYYKEGVFPDNGKCSAGIRSIYGISGADSIPILENAINVLESMNDDLSKEEIREYKEHNVTGYWLPTRENAIKPLCQLLAMAKMRPDAIWDGD